jgi:hypothetical protein
MHFTMPPPSLKIYIYAAAAVVLGAASIWWLKAAYFPVEAVQVAQTFVLHMKAQQYAQAYTLTHQRGDVGDSLAKFETYAQRQCIATRFAYTFPHQSNGNRLRRQLTGHPVEVKDIVVEFDKDCLLGVKVQKTSTGTWRVVRFASHAG